MVKIEEFFGTLQQSTVKSWRYHLKASKKTEHDILDDYYKEIPEKVDKLIEDYQGRHGIVYHYKNIISGEMTTIEYFEKLQKFVDDNRELFKESELKSDIDDILSLIDSTLYKLKELKESRVSLKDFLLRDSVLENITEDDIKEIL